MADSRIRAAIIGQGRSGRDIHGRHLRQDARYEVVAVAELLEERRLRAKDEYGCVTTDNYRDLLGRPDIDLFINATPSNLHVAITLDVIRAGKNVICEKPLARRVCDVDLLIREAGEKGVMFTVFQQSRFASHYSQIKRVVSSGVLGRIVQVGISYNSFSRRWDWQCVQANDGGNLLNTGPHPIDQALDFLNFLNHLKDTHTDGESAPPIAHLAWCAMDRANTSGDAEDYVKLVLHARGLPVVDIEISSCSAYPPSTYNIQGTLGGLKGGNTRLDWRWFRPAAHPRPPLELLPLSDSEGLPAYCSESLDWFEDSWEPAQEERDTFSAMSRQYYDMIYQHLSCGTELTITPQQVRSQIAIIEECHKRVSVSEVSEG